MRYLKKLLLGVIVYLGLFGVACLIVFCVKGAVPDVLITAMYSSGAIELLIGGTMKIKEMVADAQIKTSGKQPEKK